MLVNMKYHLVTIMALFITLAIGILIGSTIIGNDSIIEQQQKLISNLKGEFKALRKENKRFEIKINHLEEKLAVNLKYKRKMLSFLLEDKLQGEKLLIVNGENIKEESASKVMNYLHLANPTVIKSLQQVKSSQEQYTKILILGQTVEKDYKKYFSNKARIIQLSKQELNSFSKTIEKVLTISEER